MKTLDGTLYRSALDCSGLPMRRDTWHRAPLRSEDPIGGAMQVRAPIIGGGGVECMVCRRQWCPERSEKRQLQARPLHQGFAGSMALQADTIA